MRTPLLIAGTLLTLTASSLAGLSMVTGQPQERTPRPSRLTPPAAVAGQEGQPGRVAPSTPSMTVELPRTTVYNQDGNFEWGDFYGIEGGTYQLQTFNPSLVPYTTFTHSVDPKLEMETRQLVEQLRKAENEEDRSEVEEKLKETLEKYFDARMEAREKELQKIEERVTRLREEMEKRRQARDEIIDLKFQTLLNEADGLGF